MDTACFTQSMNNYENNLEENFKKNNGIFYTDIFLADKMIRSVKGSHDDIIVDPCCGAGSFLMAAAMNGCKNVYGMDQDEKAIKMCSESIKNVNLSAMDTLGVSGDEIIKMSGMKKKADVVIGNPPYAPLGDGTWIHADAHFLDRISTSGNNLFVAAIYRAFEMARAGGIISYIIPKNFLHVAGYSNLRRFLLKNKTIVSIVDLGMYFKKVRGEQIIITIKNEEPVLKAKIQLSQLIEDRFVENTAVEQGFYKDEILLFRSSGDFRIYRKMTSSYETLDVICKGYIGRGKSKAKDAVKGKEIRKFGYKNLKTPETGDRILIQNIYSSESGIIAAFGGGYEASETVTVLTDSDEEALRYVLGILHSKLCNFYLYKYCYNNSKLTMHTDAKYLKRIPLVRYGEKGTGEIAATVKRIEGLIYLSDEWYEAVQELDSQVFKLFKLTDLEAEFVREEMKKIQSKRWTKNVK